MRGVVEFLELLPQCEQSGIHDRVSQSRALCVQRGNSRIQFLSFFFVIRRRNFIRPVESDAFGLRLTWNRFQPIAQLLQRDSYGRLRLLFRCSHNKSRGHIRSPDLFRFNK